MLQVLNRAIPTRAIMGVLALGKYMDMLAFAPMNTKGEHVVSSIVYWAYGSGTYHINCAKICYLDLVKSFPSICVHDSQIY